MFCDSKLGITGRQVRSHGAAVPQESTKAFSLSSGSIRRPESPLPTYNVTEERRKSRFPFRLPIRMSKTLSISKPVMQDPEQFSKWHDRSSPIAENIQRPPTALHPAYTSHGVDHGHDYLTPPPVPGSASSRYSVTSQVTHPFAESGGRI